MILDKLTDTHISLLAELGFDMDRETFYDLDFLEDVVDACFNEEIDAVQSAAPGKPISRRGHIATEIVTMITTRPEW